MTWSSARRRGSRQFTALFGIVIATTLVALHPAQAAPGSPVGAPTNLRVDQLGATGYPGPNLELRWGPPKAEGASPAAPIAYRIYKDGRLLATTSSKDRRLLVSLLVKGAAYRFTVVAITASGEGPPAEMSVIAQMPPTMPIDLRAVPGNGSVVLTWKPPVDSGGTPITGYEVVSSPSATAPCEMTGPTSCVMRGLRNGQSYEFTVAGRNSAYPQLDGQESDPAFATPGPLPSGPQNLREVATGSTSVDLAWDPPAEVGDAPITAYQISIFEDRGPNTPRELYAITTVGPQTTTATIDGLTPGIEYYFGVRATTAGSLGAMTENVIVNPIGLSSAPKRVDILGVGAGAVKVGWEEPDPNGGSEPSEYRITATPLGGGEKVVHTCRTAIPYEECVTDEIVSGLVNGVTYSFTVAAKNSFGYGPDSTHPAIATPKGPAQTSNE